MKTRDKVAIVLLLLFWIVGVLAIMSYGSNFAVLNPKGIIAEKQSNLLIFGGLLSLIVILPVFILTFFILWKFREGNKSAKYQPDWDGSKFLETIWWGVPLILIFILSVITFKSSHDLDPSKPILADGDKKTLKVQVVALQWKWLFIYPEYDIATVNYLHIPVGTPVSFDITANAPMNSFWIPSLGGQIYAMSGMSTKLSLRADEIGVYRGVSANISGEGFADMNFKVNATNDQNFLEWVSSVKSSEKQLDSAEYDALSVPSRASSVAYYSTTEQNLYNKIVLNFEVPKNKQERNEY